MENVFQSIKGFGFFLNVFIVLFLILYSYYATK